MKSAGLQFVLLHLVFCSLTFGQAPPDKPRYLALRAGYLSAQTSTTGSQLAMNYGVTLAGIATRNSFYSGVVYHHNLTKILAYRLELNYQQKGIRNLDQAGNLNFDQPFHYLGVTPLIGITPLPGLGLFAGPEANVRVGSMPPGRVAPTPIELGLSGRLSYRYKSIGLEVGYFQALNTFNTYELNPIIKFDFKNQTWQAGLFLVLSQLKKGNNAH